MKLTSKQLSSFVRIGLFEIFLTNFAAGLQATSYGNPEKLKLAEEEEFESETLAQDERLSQASGNSLSATEDDNNNKYYYIGGALILVVLILLIIVICCCCSRRNKKKKKTKESEKAHRDSDVAVTSPTSVFEPRELDVESLAQDAVISSVISAEVHAAPISEPKGQQNIPQALPDKRVQNSTTNSEDFHGGQKSIQQSQQMEYDAPYQISDEENFHGKQKRLQNEKYIREVDSREFRRSRDIDTEHVNRSSYTDDEKTKNIYKPESFTDLHRHLEEYYNEDLLDKRMGRENYASAEMRFPNPDVNRKPSKNRESFDRNEEYVIRENSVFPNEDYRRGNMGDKSYANLIQEMRMSDRYDRFAGSRNERRDGSRPQSFQLEDPRFNSSYKSREYGSFIRKDYYSDNRRSRDNSFSYKNDQASEDPRYKPNYNSREQGSIIRKDYYSGDKRVSRDNSFTRKDPPTSERQNNNEQFYKNKNIPIPYPDYNTIKGVNGLKTLKESDEERPPVPPKPSIKPREFKGPYGPDDLDDMNNPLTMAKRDRNRGRLPFDTNDGY